MHDFKVWAPRAQTLAVVVNGEPHEMQRAKNIGAQKDWWTARVASAEPGSDYAFLVNGEGPFPDPRSPYQPTGVHGSSRLIDHSAFRWTDRDWNARPLSSAIIYELHVGTFTAAGTLAAAAERLDYLLELGVTHVELMPLNEFSGDWGWGYDGVGHYAPHHAYGAPRQLKHFVDRCHAKGLAVLLDVVYNHFGPSGNYLSHFGPYFTAAYDTPWGEAVNFDHAGSHEVRRFFLDNAAMWLRDYHFDGLRLDAVHAFHDRSAVPFLEQLSSEIDALASHLGRSLVLIAESDLNDPRVITCRAAGGMGIDAQWSDDFHHALHSVLTGETNGYYEDFGSMEHLATALRQAFVYDGLYSEHRQRHHGRPAHGISGHSFLGYSQNHDQVGNRADGRRLCHMLSLGRQKIAAALVLTSPFIPMLFQGEEFCASSPFLYFTHHEDPELGRLVSEGRRTEFRAFGWLPENVPDPQDPATFRRSKLDWKELKEQGHESMLNWYKTLIALRRATPSLTDGRLDRLQTRFDAQTRWFVVKRGEIEVLCNLADYRQTIPTRLDLSNPLCSEPGWQGRPGGIELPPDSVAILGIAGNELSG
jgi:maltooligosyltrehalose trehalohydrolase